MSKFTDNIFKAIRGPVKSKAEQLVRDAWVNKLEKSDEEARDYAQKLVDWYNRETGEIREHIRESAKPLFKNTASRWIIPVMNAVPRVIKRISLNYAQPPVRRLFKGDKEIESGSELWERVYGSKGMFRLIDLNKKFKMMNRWATLLNTIHVEVTPRRGAIDWDLHLRPSTTVLPAPDDYLEFEKLAYRYCPLDPETLRVREGWVYWAKGLHAYRLDNGDWHGVSIPEGDAEGDNPYGDEIPIVTIRMLEQDDYWGSYGADLVEGVEHTHIQLCNMWWNAFMQSHGQPIGINLGLPRGRELVVGPDNPILVDGVTKDDVEPDIKFAKSDSDVDVVQAMLDWFIKNVGQGFGLPASAWSIEDVGPESGFAKFMKNIELLEDRDDSRTMWVKVEKELFANSLMVWNYWAASNGEKPLPEDLNIDVEFPPVQFPESPTEKTTRYLMAFNAGISSPIRYFMEEEGLDQDAAKKKAIEIKKENEEIKLAVADLQAERFNKLDFGQNTNKDKSPKEPEEK